MPYMNGINNTIFPIIDFYWVYQLILVISVEFILKDLKKRFWQGMSRYAKVRQDRHDKTHQHMPKHQNTWQDMPKCDKVWQAMTRQDTTGYNNTRQDTAAYNKTQHDTKRQDKTR